MECLDRMLVLDRLRVFDGRMKKNLLHVGAVEGAMCASITRVAAFSLSTELSAREMHAQ